MFKYKLGQVYIHKDDKKGYDVKNKYATVKIVDIPLGYVTFEMKSWNKYRKEWYVTRKTVKHNYFNSTWKLCPLHNTTLGGLFV